MMAWAQIHQGRKYVNMLVFGAYVWRRIEEQGDSFSWGALYHIWAWRLDDIVDFTGNNAWKLFVVARYIYHEFRMQRSFPLFFWISDLGFKCKIRYVLYQRIVRIFLNVLYLSFIFMKYYFCDPLLKQWWLNKILNKKLIKVICLLKLILLYKDIKWY